MAIGHAISEHDVVRLRAAVQGWPRGTEGTVVSDYGSVVLVEVESDSGKPLEFIQAPVDKLDVVERASD